MNKNIKFANKRTASSGFTLIELLVVVGIIAVLGAITLVSYGNAKAKGRDTRRVADIESIRTAVEIYRSEKNVYPSDHGGIDTSAGSGSVTLSGTILDPPIGNNWVLSAPPSPKGLLNIVSDNYMAALPLDPKNTSPYFYLYEPASYNQFGIDCDAKGLFLCAYVLSAKLEDSSNSRANPGCNSCLTEHNFCVSGGEAKLNHNECGNDAP